MKSRTCYLHLVLVEEAFLNTNEKCHLLLITSVFITGRKTEWISTMPGITAYKAQSLGYSNIAFLEMQTHESSFQ